MPSHNNARQIDPARREFLARAAFGLPLSSLLLQLSARAQTLQIDTIASGLIVRGRQPDNLESPLAELTEFYTPNGRFYVRSHFAVPTLDARTWRLRVEGAVDRPLELSIADLLALASRTVDATLECAGNGRSFLSPTTKGVQWGPGAVSNARWTGVPLGAILKKAGVQNGAVEVILEGADSGEPKDPPKPSGAIHFARSLPIAKATHPDVLVAHRMNDAALSGAHGFPARAIVPGWYGVASVKWLSRIVVTKQPFHGHFQSVDYAVWDRSTAGLPSRVPVTRMQVKSQIVRPAAAETVKVGTAYPVRGWAWTGEAEIAKVEVSTDNGRTWNPARLTGDNKQTTWRSWEYTWNVPDAPGEATLLARATDTAGNAQPLQRQPDRENYMINHVLPVLVEVAR